MKKSRIVFRLEGTSQTGMGHLQRCTVLAEELQKRGHDVIFLCGSETKKYTKPYRGKVKFQYVRSQTDISAFRNADVAILDHLKLGRSYERKIKKQFDIPMLAIDDLCHRKHDCDVLINPNPGFNPEKYKNLLPSFAKVMVGPSYAPIQASILKKRMRRALHNGQVKNLIVNFGGADQHGMCKRVAQALQKSTYRGKVTFILGHSNEWRPAIEAISKNSPQKMIVQGFVDMAKELTQADFFIGSSSSGSWERCLLGIPSILLSLIDNQISIGKFLGERGAAHYAGSGQKMTVDRLSRLIDKLLPDLSWIQRTAKSAYDLLDGQGAIRCADEIEMLIANSHMIDNRYRSSYLHDHTEFNGSDLITQDSQTRIKSRYLPWDTHILQVHAARIDELTSKSQQANDIKRILFNHIEKLIHTGTSYIDVRIGHGSAMLIPIFQELGFRTMDEMNIYVSSKPNSSTYTLPSGYRISLKRPTSKELKQIKKFGMKSFVHSRIYKDKNIPRKRADHFYASLLESSIKNAFTIVTVYHRNQIVGFCIGSRDKLRSGKSLGVLSMIAVHPAHAGRGIGKTLVIEFLHQMHKKHEIVEIGTQIQNKAANLLYQSLDLPIRSKLTTLHWWAKDNLKQMGGSTTLADIQKEYDRSSKEKNEFQKVKWGSQAKMTNRFRRAMKELPFQRTRHWLDVGCGTGLFQTMVKKNYPHIQATGIDVSSKLLDYASKKNEGMDVRFVKKDFQSFSNGKYDLITSIGVLQKTNFDMHSFFRKAHRLLKSGGQLFIDTKHAGWNMFRESKLTPDHDISWFHVDDLVKSARKAGFRSIQVRGFLPESNTVVKPANSHTIFLKATKAS